MHWLAHTANVGGEQGDGGASPLLVPLLHHALRRCAYPLPNGVHLAQSEGGRVTAMRAAAAAQLRASSG